MENKIFLKMFCNFRSVCTNFKIETVVHPENYTTLSDQYAADGMCVPEIQQSTNK